ncbi:hypothetical protein SLS57_001380 [Botryosphaeria dothidea]
MSVPPPSGPSGRPEPALSRRQQPTQGKRNGITHIACRPCQRRKQKCDGRRPVCSPCRKKPSDCLYDAESDQRRTTALKARIQDLNKETEDLKDIVKGIATAPNRDAALAAARTLAATGFRQTANVADAFRKEQAAEDEASKQQERTVAEPMACTPLWTGSASILYSPWSHGATTDAAIHNSPGRMSLEPWSLQAQAELLQFAQSGLDNDPAEPSSPFWKIEDQKNPSLQLVSQESGEIENTTRQPESVFFVAKHVIQMYSF